MQHKCPIRISVACAALFACILLSFLTEKRSNAFYFELGEHIPTDKAYYYTGFKAQLWTLSMDLENVNNLEAGCYKVKIKKFFIPVSSIDIFITDTQKPQLVLTDKKYVFEVGEPIYCDDFVQYAFDLSGDVSLRFSNCTPDLSVCYNDTCCLNAHERGHYNCDIIAEDINGNCECKNVGFDVIYGPVIENVKDFYVSVGNENIDWISDISSVDSDSGADITDSLEVDISKVDINSPGVYPVTYSAYNEYGFSTSKQCNVYVMEPNDLQKLYGFNSINTDDNYIYGLSDIHDRGYIKIPNINEVFDVNFNSIVHIMYFDTNIKVSGSGFIIKQTDDYILICTNNHVVTGMNRVNVGFGYDGSCYYTDGVVEASFYQPDVAFVKVLKSTLPNEIEENLITVHIDYDLWDSLNSKDNLQIGLEAIDERGNLWVQSEGRLLEKNFLFDTYYDNYDYPLAEVSMELPKGVSGSPIFDANGNLICMAACKAKENGKYHYFAVSVADIMRCLKRAYENE